MKKYHQLVLFITTVVSLSLLLVYRQEYNRLHYVLEVFNFFGQPCNVSNLEYAENAGGYKDWGVEPIWQQNDDIYIFSAFWIDHQVHAIVVHTQQTVPTKQCYLWFENREKPEIGKFLYTYIDTGLDRTKSAYFYYCSLKQDRQPYAVSFSTKNKKNYKKVLITVFTHSGSTINTTVCIAPTDFSKPFIVEFISYHKLVGISNFIFYHDSIPYRLIKIIGNLSVHLNINVRFFRWNYPLSGEGLTHTLVEKDCILRTRTVSDTSITLEMNEFFVPAENLISNAKDFNRHKSNVPERIGVPVQIFCIENKSRHKPIVLQNTEVGYNDEKNVRYVYGNVSRGSTVTHSLGNDVTSIHKYIDCLKKPSRIYSDTSILRFSIDLTRSTLVQLFLHNDL